ncbi:hypothetical protein [Nonomuraea rhizosphaerae]|uniref:hypothetical protein n=1 Tax=Nonomuraea rhizosphaerae TaxID=2665663 RepID=UPI001C5F58E3|nr:hypothetical protein [Nonomuraea rhizosphaerae]
MMPQLLTVGVKRPDRRLVRVRVPVVPVVLLLSPVLLLALVAGVVAGHVYHVDTLRALRTGWRIVCALPGTRFDAQFDRTAVLVAIR